MNDKPKRRWFRFSLRTLLLLVTIASAGFGWLGVKVRAKQREREAVKAIQKFGGIVNYDFQYEWYEKPRPSHLKPIPPGPAWLRSLLGDDAFANVSQVCFPSRSKDEDLLHLEGLNRIRALRAGGSAITDVGCIRISALNQLEVLDLRGTSVTDAGIIHLKRLTKLEELSLLDAPVSEAAVKDLQNALRNLKIYRLERHLWRR